MLRRIASPFAMAVLGAVAIAPSTAGAAVKKGPYLQDVRASEAEIRIEVDPPTPAKAEIFSLAASGKDAGAGSPVAHVEMAAAQMHALRLGGLQPATTYRYRVEAGGETREGSLTTAPADDAKTPFSFLIEGDNRTNDDAHAAVAKALAQAPGDFIVNTGDLVENGGRPELWQKFFDIEEPVLRDRCLFAAVGNHELIDAAGTSFLRYFGEDTPGVTGLRRLYRTVRWENTRFFFLNGTDEFTGSDERRWLDDELGKADGEKDLVWRIVVVHHGPWSSSVHGNNLKIWNAGLIDSFRAHKIDLFLSGHDHVYERGDFKGILYVVSGGGGAPLYAAGDPISSTRKAESTYHFIEAKIDGPRFSMVARRVDGSVLDTCGFQKGRGWDCDGPSITAATTPDGDAATPTADAKSSQNTEPTAKKSSSCGCSEPGRSGSAGGWVAVLVCGALLRRRKARYAAR